MAMNNIEKEKLIKADIESIENRVRHAFNQGYDLGFKDGQKRAKEPTTKNDLGVDAVSRQEVLYLIADDDLSMGQVVKGIHALPSVTPQEPTPKKDLEVEAEDCISREYLRKSMIEYGWSHPDSTVTEYVESLPLVYPKSEKPSGKWIGGICSCCNYDWGKDAPIASVPKFCPNCGCAMRGDENGNE